MSRMETYILKIEHLLILFDLHKETLHNADDPLSRKIIDLQSADEIRWDLLELAWVAWYRERDKKREYGPENTNRAN